MRVNAECKVRNSVVEKLIKFCHQHKNGIYVYGAGAEQKIVGQYLEKKQVQVLGYVVSKSKFVKEPKTYTVNQLICDLPEIGIVVAVSDIHFNDILNEIVISGFPLQQVFFLSGSDKASIIKYMDLQNKVKNRKECNVLSIDQYYSFYAYIKGKCKNGQYNLFLHRHLGDSLIMLALREVFEQKYGAPIHYIVQKSHEALMALYGVTNYTVIDFNKLMDEPRLHEFSLYEQDQLKEDMCERMFPAIPQKSLPFVATPVLWIKSGRGYKNLVDGWAQMLGLEVEAITPPPYLPQITDNFRKVIEDIGNIKKIVLLAPEAQSFHGLDKTFWVQLAEQLKKGGFIPVTNALYKDNEIKGTYNLKMTLADLLALACNCHAVYSLRSGLCDCIVGGRSDLYIYYTNEISLDYHSLNKCFVLNRKVEEIVV